MYVYVCTQPTTILYRHTYTREVEILSNWTFEVLRFWTAEIVKSLEFGDELKCSRVLDFEEELNFWRVKILMRSWNVEEFVIWRLVEISRVIDFEELLKRS